MKVKFLKNPFHIEKLFFRSDGNFGLKGELFQSRILKGNQRDPPPLRPDKDVSGKLVDDNASVACHFKVATLSILI